MNARYIRQIHSILIYWQQPHLLREYRTFQNELDNHGPAEPRHVFLNSTNRESYGLSVFEFPTEVSKPDDQSRHDWDEVFVTYRIDMQPPFPNNFEILSYTARFADRPDYIEQCPPRLFIKPGPFPSQKGLEHHQPWCLGHLPWTHSGSGYNRVRVCQCGAETHDPDPEPPSAPMIKTRKNPDLRNTALDVLVVKGTYFRHGIGWVPEGVSARQENDGPLVPGPWAYTFPLSSCVAANPEHGTGAEIRRNKARGLEHEVTDGDFVEVDSISYMVKILRGQYIELVMAPPLVPDPIPADPIPPVTMKLDIKPLCTTARTDRSAIGEFWCDVCDNMLVNPANLTTGRFFQKRGHILRREISGEVRTGDFVEITWAVCAGCLVSRA